MDTLFNSTECNPRGIPGAPFVNQVEDFIKDPQDFELCFNKFQERLSKYKFMQESKLTTVKQLKIRIPDLENTLKICNNLKRQSENNDDDGDDEPLQVNYQLNDTLYTKAEISKIQDTVCLWLGADVMLEYPIDEAIELLNKKLNDAKRNLDTCTEDVEFLRENITTMEVNCARLYNWDVERRQNEKETEAIKDLKL
ncbi:tubulin-binding prefolding complex subunit PAC10 NDAI_0A06820 [Naumovozyma dairenensis CBS 421]|uniref:Prefoldin subunit 3 n=1 Tax=Naumovozyma dairenensis (strain ATCC 10597 / BCRC 20456 / CBS 421 / NBRC 0211 / NRRL Y-12639) TaxID=1071378 RepID=G0W4U8_NAUDC|nr:hypothetical protein NDAI_0A06820 [Naumovozyma dairenensis CBS 421]CCD22836.1 hypothetical protein NDAI_0A06820 [Naumovozyma dairenensis CBS 421]